MLYAIYSLHCSLLLPQLTYIPSVCIWLQCFFFLSITMGQTHPKTASVRTDKSVLYKCMEVDSDFLLVDLPCKWCNMFDCTDCELQCEPCKRFDHIPRHATGLTCCMAPVRLAILKSPMSIDEFINYSITYRDLSDAKAIAKAKVDMRLMLSPCDAFSA